MPSRSGRLLAPLVFAALALASSPRPARAESWLVPVEGRAIAVPATETICAEGTSLGVFARDADATRVRPPVQGDALGATGTLALAPRAEECGRARIVTLVAVGAAPTVDATSLVIEADAGRGSLRGRNLESAVVRVRVGAREIVDRCAEAGPGSTSCTFGFAREASADPSTMELVLLPAGANDDRDAVLFDAQGRRLPDPVPLRPSRVVLDRLVPLGAGLDSMGGAARVPLVHPDSVAFVECEDAVCDVDAGSLLVRDEHGDDDHLAVHVHLRPRVVLHVGSSFDANPIVRLALARCPAALVSPPPIRSLERERVVVRVEGACARDPSLAIESSGESLRIVGRVEEADRTYVMVELERIGGDALELDVRRPSGIGAHVRVPTRRLPSLHARLELDGLGPVDFLPTNRAARVLPPALPGGGELVPIGIDGVYEVMHGEDGHVTARALPGVAGSVALRYAVRDGSLPRPLADEPLVEVGEAIERPIHAADVPVPLDGSGDAPFVELVCAGEGSTARAIAPGLAVAIPFAARDTCHLVFHRERLAEEDGTQSLVAEIEITRPDGSIREEAHVTTRVVLRPGPAARTLYVGGVREPFDRIRVRVAVAEEGVDWAVPPADDASAPALQWTVIVGTDRFRIYGTTSFPTALFRVSSDSGLMALNAGALFRFVRLSREGRESIVGLETGAMWVGLAGTNVTGVRSSPVGEVALVAGVGLGVPIANGTRATQTSISLHAWFEYEVSRAVRSGGGNPLGFVFGPSITIGDVGTDF